MTRAEMHMDAAMVVKEAIAILEGVSSQGGTDCAANTTLASKFATDRASRLYQLGLHSFVLRVWEFLACDANTVLCSFMLLDKVAGVIEINELNVQKMWYTALVLCIKYMEDEYMTDIIYAEICDVTTEGLFDMQAAMLNVLDWTVHVDADVVALFVDALEKRICFNATQNDRKVMLAKAGALVAQCDTLCEEVSA